MAREISIAVRVKDNFSDPLSKASQSFSKLQQDAEKLEKTLGTLSRKQALIRQTVYAGKEGAAS